MFILKRTNSPYWYARIQTVNGPVDKSTKTRIKREAKKIGKQWQDEADLIKASKTGGSKLIVPTLLYLADQATSGSLETKTLDTEVNKIRRILSDTSCGIPLGIYLDQEVVEDFDGKVPTTRLYDSYKYWIKETEGQRYAPSAKSFNKIMRERFGQDVVKKEGDGRTYFMGFKEK